MANTPKTPKRKSNPVAKNLPKFNRPATHVDRKKAEKGGYQKHKGEIE
jgi:hypothetical protein